MANPNTRTDTLPRRQVRSELPRRRPAAGPVREAGGTTGEGNLSPAQANRTGGATGGVQTDPDAESPRDPARCRRGRDALTFPDFRPLRFFAVG